MTEWMIIVRVNWYQSIDNHGPVITGIPMGQLWYRYDEESLGVLNNILLQVLPTFIAKSHSASLLPAHIRGHEERSHKLILDF